MERNSHSEQQDFSPEEESRLLQYFLGELGNEEQAEVERWIAANSGRAQELLRLKAEWDGISVHSQAETYDIEGALAAAKGRRGAFTNAQRSSVAVPTQSGWTSKMALGLALAAVVLTGSWFFYHTENSATQSQYSTYTTRPGQRASVLLADGSRVIIGPATTVKVGRDPSAISAEISGEALFKVNHASMRPFTVTAYGVTTRVLGTEFIVRAHDASHIRVAVREGRVSVQSPIATSNNAAIVGAGEAALVTSNKLPSVESITDIASDFAWAEGELVLRDVPLGEALVRLSRWYGMKFEVADSSLLKSYVTSNFLTTFSESEMGILARAIGANVKRSGNTVTFSAVQQ